MKRIIENSFLLVLLIPLLFTNIKSSHDWGDDFAQYIHQAQNITKGISQNETGYIFNSGAFLGPKAYPVGFPLLLSPIIYYWGMDYEAINVYLSIFLACSCFIGYLLLRKCFSAGTAIIVTLLIAYNPVTLNFKAEILSDIPFLFFSSLVVWLVLKKETLIYSLAIGALLGFCFHIRSIALVLLIAVILYRIITLWREKKLNLSALKFGLLTMISFFSVVTIIRLLWPADSSYPQLFVSGNPFLSAINHLSYQNEEFHRFFRNYEIKDYYLILCLAASSLTCFSWLGFFYQLKYNRYHFFTIYTTLYILALIVYAYSDTGIRFVFPLVFILFYYAVTGLKIAVKPISRNTFWLPYIIGFFVLFSYHESWQQISEHEKDILEGPQTVQVQELFEFIKSTVPKQEVVAFDKPRALSLYTGRRSVCLNDKNNKEELLLQIRQFKVRYWITNTLLSSQSNRELAKDTTLNFQLVFDNGSSKVYKTKNL